MINRQSKCCKKKSKSPNGHHSGLVETVEKNEKRLGQERDLVALATTFILVRLQHRSPAGPPDEIPPSSGSDVVSVAHLILVGFENEI